MNMEGFIKDEVDMPVVIPRPLEGTDSKIIYFDEHGKSCDKEQAVSAIIAEYDNDGNLINENWMELKDEKKDAKQI